MSDQLKDLIVAVDSLQSTVEKLESDVVTHSTQLATHAELHASHARLIAKANELAIAAAEKAEMVRSEGQKMLKSALDDHAASTSLKLDKLKMDGDQRTALLEKIQAWQKNPIFKAAWFIGGVIGGAIAAYLAAHH